MLPWGTATVIDAVLNAWRSAGVTRIVVVVRANDPQLAERCQSAGVLVVQPAVAPPDMKTSVRHALHAARAAFAPSPDDAWLLAPADMPRLSPTIIRQLIAAHDPAAPQVLIPVVGGKRGHPLLVPWRWAERVDELAENEGVNALLHRLPLRELATDDPAIRLDLDTPEEYERAIVEETSRRSDEPVN